MDFDWKNQNQKSGWQNERKNNKTSGAINESLYCKLKFISRAGIFMADIYGGGIFYWDWKSLWELKFIENWNRRPISSRVSCVWMWTGLRNTSFRNCVNRAIESIDYNEKFSLRFESRGAFRLVRPFRFVLCVEFAKKSTT